MRKNSESHGVKNYNPISQKHFETAGNKAPLFSGRHRPWAHARSGGGNPDFRRSHQFPSPHPYPGNRGMHSPRWRFPSCLLLPWWAHRLELLFGDSRPESTCKAACLMVSAFFSFLAVDLAAWGGILSFRVVSGWKLWKIGRYLMSPQNQILIFFRSSVGNVWETGFLFGVSPGIWTETVW